MPTRVIDASALVALAFDEIGADDVAAACRGHELHAPALLAYELANAAVGKARLHPELSESFADALHLALALSPRFHSIDSESLFALADQTGLTAYDAAYLLLAMQLDAPLITLDARLANAARAAELLVE